MLLHFLKKLLTLKKDISAEIGSISPAGHDISGFLVDLQLHDIYLLHLC